MREQHDHQRICIKRRSPEPNNIDTSVADAATSPVRTCCRRPCQVTRAYLYLLSDISLTKTGFATLGTAMHRDVPSLLRPTTARRVFSNRKPYSPTSQRERADSVTRPIAGCLPSNDRAPPQRSFLGDLCCNEDPSHKIQAWCTITPAHS